MDTPALAILWIVVAAAIAFGAALGGTTWVYLADQRRQDAPRRQAGPTEVETEIGTAEQGAATTSNAGTERRVA